MFKRDPYLNLRRLGFSGSLCLLLTSCIQLRLKPFHLGLYERGRDSLVSIGTHSKWLQWARPKHKEFGASGYPMWVWSPSAFCHLQLLWINFPVNVWGEAEFPTSAHTGCQCCRCQLYLLYHSASLRTALSLGCLFPYFKGQVRLSNC